VPSLRLDDLSALGNPSFGRLAQVVIEEGERSLPCILPFGGVAIAVKNVTYTGINLHLTRRMNLLEKALQVLKLAQRNAFIGIALQDEDGRHAGHMFGEIIREATVIFANRFETRVLGRFG
jgi:hypothetical protein